MLTGNREFNEIYKKYKNLVLQAAYIYSGDYTEAEDITQDTFLKLYIGYDKMRKDNIPSWLYTTAKNAALTYKKKQKRQILDCDREEDEKSVDEPAAKSAEEEFLRRTLELENSELHRRIVADMRKHNPRWYDAMILVFYMELPQAKAAELMGIRVSALHAMLHRMRNWLRKKYGVEYEEMNRER
ncbi:MAG TPA: sigma-70 family RNA polymerase sigma factor [Candidatus Mediterraneibacter excrementigallinarum]|nr:sigma-70 family RNA polymerase sigma factor [Candidatus Mediterraneibacter excrementigallinarum]